MKAFNAVMARGFKDDASLGCPHPDGEAGIARRQNYYATLTGGKGFRQPKTTRIGARIKRGSISRS